MGRVLKHLLKHYYESRAKKGTPQFLEFITVLLCIKLQLVFYTPKLIQFYSFQRKAVLLSRVNYK